MDEIIAKLKAHGCDDTKAAEIAEKAKTDGVTDLSGASLLTEAEWTGYGLPKIAARKLVAELKAAAAPAPAPVAAAPGMASLLPTVPADDAFLASLQTGGTLKPSSTDVVSAVRAVFASRLGLYDVEDRILEAIETRAESLGESCPDIFYDLQKASDRKEVAKVLRALGVPGNFVTERRKKAFLTRMQGIWVTLTSFQEQVHSWRQTWQANMTNPAAMMTAFAAAASGNGAAALAGGFNDAPDTAPIIDAATGVIDDINKMFAGTGIPIARALAADSIQLRQLIEKPELTAAVGASTRDEMLKVLNLGVGADIVRAERSVAQYMLAVLELPKVPETQLALYIVALENLGTGIPWEKLAGSGRASDGSSPRTPFGQAQRKSGFTG